MLDYKYADLYYEDSISKQLKIEAEDGTVITNEDIYLEEVTLQESICSDDSLTFGSCEASKFEIKIANRFSPLIDQWITVSEVLDGHEDDPFTFGKYKVQSDRPTADRIYREIVAYDSMYDIINADKEDVADWYNEILPYSYSTVTLKTFRTSFINHFGIEEESITLPNDSMIVEKTISASELSGKAVINAICEINGCFGHIGRDGKFQYIFLNTIVSSEEASILGEMNLGTAKLGGTEVSQELDASKYRASDYEDYECQTIDKVHIQESEDDVGGSAGEGENCYTITGNFLVYGKDQDELESIAQTILSTISGLVYRPAEITATGNPCIIVGDSISLDTKYQHIDTYVLERTLKGIQALVDTYIAEGTEIYANTGNSLESAINQLKGKSNTLTRDLESTKSTIEDVEKGLSTQITQTAEGLKIEIQNVQNSVNELDKTAITGSTIEYYQSDSPTELTGGEWSEDEPTWTEGTYIWVRTTIRTGDGSQTITEPVCITGNTGAQGEQGEPGEEGPQGPAGEDGISVESIVAYYSKSGSPDYYPTLGGDTVSILGTMILGTAVLGNTGTWELTPPELDDDDYLWLRFLVTYSNGTSAWTEPCCLTDKSVKKQIDILNEKYNTFEVTVDGLTSSVTDLQGVVTNNYSYMETRFSTIQQTVDSISTEVSKTTETVGELSAEAITGTVIEYYLSTSPTELEGGDWSEEAPEWKDGYYVWTRTVITTGVGDTEVVSTTDPVCITGNTGAEGTNGIGVDFITAYYAVSGSDSYYPSHGDDGTTSVLGTMVLGTAILGNSGLWETEMPSVSDTEYLWVCYLIEYSDGHSEWTVPYCMTDASVRNQLNTITKQMSSIEQLADSITMTVEETVDKVDSLTGETETLTTRVSKIEQTIDSISFTVSGSLGGTAKIEMKVGEEALDADIDLSNVREAFANDEKSSVEIAAGTVAFVSNTLIIESDQLKLRSDGSLEIYTTPLTIDDDGNLIIDTNQLKIDKDQNLIIDTNQFKLDEEENAVFSGTLNAPGGNIGGFTIGEKSIYNGTESMDSEEPGIYIGTDGIKIISDFWIRSNTYFMIDEHGDVTTVGYSSYSSEGVTYYSRLEMSGGWLNLDEVDAYGNTPDLPEMLLVNNLGITGIQGYVNGSSGSYYTWFNVMNQYETVGVTGTLYVNGNTITGSDESLKEDIVTLSSQKSDYEKVLETLEPVTFEYKTGGKHHIGFTYQNAIKALEAGGIDPEDSAMVQTYEDPNTKEKVGGIEYNDIVALLVYEVQKLKSEIEEIKAS